MRNTKTQRLINEAAKFIQKLQANRGDDFGVKNKIMTNEFVETIKKESAKSIENIVKNCNELKDVYLETSKNFAKVAKITKKM